MTETRPPRLFISYSHFDKDHKEELQRHLKPLIEDGIVQAWDDRQIDGGADWEATIHENLENAEIILLLVSSDFLASDFCRHKEMKRAMERHEADNARVIPVILRSCRWQRQAFARLQVIPENGKPIAQWADRDEYFTKVVETIEQAAETHRARVAERIAAERAAAERAAAERAAAERAAAERVLAAERAAAETRPCGRTPLAGLPHLPRRPVCPGDGGSAGG